MNIKTYNSVELLYAQLYMSGNGGVISLVMLRQFVDMPLLLSADELNK
jgi:hypothetical protein